MKLVLLVIGFMITTTAFAGVLSQNECSDTDIRETNPKIRNNPELKEILTRPRNQDSVGWCYAFVAADLMSAEMGQAVSALHISSSYNNRVQSNVILRKVEEKIRKEDSTLNFETVFEGGNTDIAIKEMVKGKVICPENLFPFDVNHSKQTHDFIKQLEALKKVDSDSNDMTGNVCSLLDGHFPGIENKASIAHYLLDENLNISLKELARIRCEGKMLPVPSMRLKHVPLKNDLTGFLKLMNEKLDAGKPVAIEYYTHHFVNKPPSEGGHASVVMARRWKDGQCQFKIRNTWGQSCAGYRDNVECIKDEGAIWVKDADLGRATDSMQFVE